MGEGGRAGGVSLRDGEGGREGTGNEVADRVK